VLNDERVQIARSSKPNADEITTALTFTENGYPNCDASDDPLNGFTFTLESGSCAHPGGSEFSQLLGPFTVHTVNHEAYGTFFLSSGPETVSARIVELPTPPAPGCGQWTLNLEVAGINSSPLGNGPFALLLTNAADYASCFNITNAIVGNQIDPPTRTERRGVRR
jgi:hypothetical protein